MMKTPRRLSHILYLLAELAFSALLVGCVDAACHGAGMLATCGALAAASLFAVSLVLHLLLVQGERTAASRPAPRDSQPTATPTSEQPSTPSSVREPAPATAPRPEVSPALASASATAEPPQAARHLKPSHESSESQPAPAPDACADTDNPMAPEDASETDALAVTLPTPSALDLGIRLVQAEDPIAELKGLVADIRSHADTEPLHPDDTPSGLEAFALRMMEEAGLLDADASLPRLDVSVEPSGMLRLHALDRETPPSAQLSLLRLEAALNAIKLAYERLPLDATVEDAYRLNQSFARSIAAQAEVFPLALPFANSLPDGEWAVRYGIAQAVATLRLPHRLELRYRTNVADGNVALEVGFMPAEVFARSCHVAGLGIVPTSGDLRQQAAADYMLRLALLLAGCVFRCSGLIRHVWVAAIAEGAERRTCYLSVDFDRYRFDRLDLTDLGDLTETYRSFAPMLRYEQGWLRPVRQGFHLEEERFCPIRRYTPVSLSSRRLAGQLAERLGTDHVAGLSIEEADGRSAMASLIMRRLVPESDTQATSKNVRTIMQLAGDDPDPTVRQAAERVINGLIEGSIPSNPLVLGEEFVRGDILTRTVDHAKELLAKQRPQEAYASLAPLIASLDETGLYADSPTVSYRYFSSYVERTMYNRLYGPVELGRTVLLVPDAYYEAHLMLSVCELMAGHADRAYTHAQRMVDLAPLDARARLHLVKCLEELDRDDEAVAQLCQLLEEAHEPIGLGIAYYRMAAFQWMRDNVVAAQACYQRAMQVLPSALPMISMEYTILSLQHPELVQDEVTSEEIDEVLSTNGIPVAPTNHTSEVFYECAQASVDAEIFPVARNFAFILDAFDGGGIISDVVRSLEDAPDR